LVELHHHLPGPDELRVERLVQVEHRLEAAVVLGRELGPLVARAPEEDPLHLCVRFGPRRVELALDQVLPADAAAPGLPELRLERTERDPPIPAGVRAVADQPPGELEVAAPRHHPVAQVLGRHHPEPGERAVEHRHVHELALAASLALAQRGQDAEGRRQRSAADVGDLPGRLHGRAAGRAGQAEQPVQPEVVHVVAGAGGVGTVLAVAGDGAVDEPPVLLAQALVADAQPLHHAGAKRLQQHVALAHEPQQDLPTALAFQIQPNRSFAPVQGKEKGGLG
jgi:hypothetical protein